jgi:hypothetical protein
MFVRVESAPVVAERLDQHSEVEQHLADLDRIAPDSLEDRGAGRAEEMAARTRNKSRAQAGESKQSSHVSRNDISPYRRERVAGPRIACR